MGYTDIKVFSNLENCFQSSQLTQQSITQVLAFGKFKVKMDCQNQISESAKEKVNNLLSSVNSLLNDSINEMSRNSNVDRQEIVKYLNYKIFNKALESDTALVLESGKFLDKLDASIQKIKTLFPVLQLSTRGCPGGEFESAVKTGNVDLINYIFRSGGVKEHDIFKAVMDEVMDKDDPNINIINILINFFIKAGGGSQMEWILSDVLDKMTMSLQYSDKCVDMARKAAIEAGRNVDSVDIKTIKAIAEAKVKKNEEILNLILKYTDKDQIGALLILGATTQNYMGRISIKDQIKIMRLFLNAGASESRCRIFLNKVFKNAVDQKSKESVEFLIDKVNYTTVVDVYKMELEKGIASNTEIMTLLQTRFTPIRDYFESPAIHELIPNVQELIDKRGEAWAQKIKKQLHTEFNELTPEIVWKRVTNIPVNLELIQLMCDTGADSRLMQHLINPGGGFAGLLNLAKIFTEIVNKGYENEMNIFLKAGIDHFSISKAFEEMLIKKKDININIITSLLPGVSTIFKTAGLGEAICRIAQSFHVYKKADNPTAGIEAKAAMQKNEEIFNVICKYANNNEIGEALIYLANRGEVVADVIKFIPLLFNASANTGGISQNVINEAFERAVERRHGEIVEFLFDKVPTNIVANVYERESAKGIGPHNMEIMNIFLRGIMKDSDRS